MQVRQQNSAVVSIATLLARHDRFGDGAGKVGLVAGSSMIPPLAQACPMSSTG
jgi:hypothetical protein